MNDLRQSITTAEEADAMDVETGNYMDLETSPGVWEKVKIPVIEDVKSKDPVSILLESIWSKYDDGDGNLTHEELKQLTAVEHIDVALYMTCKLFLHKFLSK